MKITLFTDLRYTTRPGATGVDKHIERMASGLRQQPGVDLTLLAASDQENSNPVLHVIPLRRLPFSWRTCSTLWTTTGHPVADRWVGDADWVYCPKNDWIPLRKTHYAVTIHGAHELDPDLPPLPGLKGRLWAARNRTQYRKMCQRADLILTVSNFLKERIVSWFNADPDRVAIVGNGIDDCFFAAGEALESGARSPEPGVRNPESGVRTPEPGTRSPEPGIRNPDTGHRPPNQFPLHPPPSTFPFAPSTLQPSAFSLQPYPFLLAVGGLNFLDGGDRVIALAKKIQRLRLDLRIKVAGCQHEKGMVERAQVTGVMDLLGYVPSEQLAQWMRGAVALYYPTRYETFGMAAAEAMAVGTPVVTCRSTAVPEIVGDAGIYVDADDPRQALDAIQALQTDAKIRMTHINRGRQRAARHTWAACVERLVRELELRM